MIASAINLISAFLFLAAAIGAVGVVCLWLLPEFYGRWKADKHDIDCESELYDSVVEALDKADGRPLAIVYADEEEGIDGEQVSTEESREV